MALVFDIETVGVSYDSLPDSVQEYLVRPAAGDAEEAEKLKRMTALLPYTGEVVCIAMFNTTSKDVGGRVLFRTNPALPATPEPESGTGEDGAKYVAFPDEASMLQEFWTHARAFREKSPPFVTFNGRGFDVPYLAVRSGILGVKVSCDMLGNRYRTDVHVDLYDQLCFQGAANRRFNLDLVSRAFGIESPKSPDAHGNKVQVMWDEGRVSDIAKYCFGDVRATAEIYRRWKDFMAV